MMHFLQSWIGEYDCQCLLFVLKSIKSLLVSGESISDLNAMILFLFEKTSLLKIYYQLKTFSKSVLPNKKLARIFHHQGL